MSKKLRWLAVCLSLALLASFALACGSNDAQTGEDQEEGSGSFEGVELRIVGANHPWQEAIEPMLPEFEEQTGMKVNFEKFFEDQLTQKLTTEFTAGSANIDVFMIRPLQEGKLFSQNGWVADIADRVDDPEFDFDDLTASSVNSMKDGEKLFGIPIVTEREILYYRKDIFEENNLQPPTTLDELMEVAEQLNDPGNDFYGIVSRGERAASVTQFSSYLYGFGGDFMVDGDAALDTSEAIQAFQFYGDMLNHYGPPGVLNMSWPQAAGLFGQGKAAMYTDADSIFPNLLDEEKSIVGDKVGFAVFPEGPGGKHPYNVTSWGVAINETSQQKDAAWEFIKWVTGKEITTKVQATGVPSARQSVWDTPEGTAQFPVELVDVIMQSNEIGKEYDRPLVIRVNDARDIIGTVINTGITGGDVEEAAKQANEQFQALIDSEAN